MNTDFEMDNLSLEIEELKTLGADIFLTGFDAAEIEDLLNRDKSDVVEDEAPEPPEKPITKLGDIWLIGRHKLLCGNSTLTKM